MVVLGIMQCSCSHTNLKNSFLDFNFLRDIVPSMEQDHCYCVPSKMEKVLRSSLFFPKLKDST